VTKTGKAILTKIVFTQEDYQTLTDMLLDRLMLPGCFNPVVQFLAERTGFPILDVDKAFLFMKNFGEFSKMPFAQLLKACEPGPVFWWDLFSMYDQDSDELGIKKMLRFLSKLDF
jgi:hypothetical protein